MAAEPVLSTKKHRVIGWKPEDADRDTSRPHGWPRWARISAALGAGLLFALVLLAGFVTWRLNQIRQQDAANAAGLSPRESLRDAFVGRSRAEFAREAATRGLEGVRKTPSDHPAVLRRLVEIERIVYSADKAFGDGNYGQAVQLYDSITAETKAFASSLEDMRKTQEGYDQFMVNEERISRFKDLAPEDYDAALTAAGAARTLLQEGSFTLARQKMNEGATLLASIEQRLADEIEQRLADGRAALATGSGGDARKAFERVLELQPGHELAVKGLDRAKNIERVFALLREAEAQENKSDFEAAQKTFEQAFALDGQSATAQAGVARMKVAIRDRDFDSALAHAQAARTDQNWDAAIAGFEVALKLYPDNADVKTQLADARVRQREAHIQRSLTDAYALERVYDWSGARQIYLQLLDYEPHQSDAEEGLLRTGRVIRALLKFDRLIDDARAQAQRASFQSAIAAFNEAMANKPSYLELTSDQVELKNLLERQSRPIEVTIVSDNKTYVTIQGVRLLGRFQSTSVPVLPGNYEIIGRRRGYEDVREVIRVRAGDSVPPLTIVASKRVNM